MKGVKVHTLKKHLNFNVEGKLEEHVGRHLQCGVLSFSFFTPRKSHKCLQRVNLWHYIWVRYVDTEGSGNKME